MAKSKKQTKKIEKTKTEKKPEVKPKKKVGLVIGIIILALVAVGVGGGILYKCLTRTTISTETVAISEDARSFSGLFREYVRNRLRAQNLYGFTFRELNNAEILDELTELKDGFSKVSRGMNNFDDESEYAEVAEILKNDATVYLKSVRELRGVMTGDYTDEADRQVDFIKIVETSEENLRSGLYVSRAAFSEETGGIGTEGILIFNGEMLAEVGGGVMNIFVGDLSEGVTAVTTGDFTETVRRIDAKRLYGFLNSRLIRFGEGIFSELEVGKLETVKIQLNSDEAEVTREKSYIVGKSTWDFSGEKEIPGLLKIEEGGMSTVLKETIEEI